MDYTRHNALLRAILTKNESPKYVEVPICWGLITGQKRPRERLPQQR